MYQYFVMALKNTIEKHVGESNTQQDFMELHFFNFVSESYDFINKANVEVILS